MLASACLFLSLWACNEGEAKKDAQGEGLEKRAKNSPTHLYLPDQEENGARVDLGASDGYIADDVTFGPTPGVSPTAPGVGRCPPEMVLVAGAVCIDRFEVSLVDAKTGQALSPHYPPSLDLTTILFERWQRNAPQSRMSLGRNTPVPIPPSFQLTEDFAPRAQSLRGQIPSGYLSRTTSEAACKNAGKRLCSRAEWVRACRGERGTKFPYGDTYEEGVCNVFRKNHPARLIHGNSSKNHLDPRLGLASDEDGPLLRSTGETTSCVSRWGHDGVYDMVGNLDEWLEDPNGSFVGGFFSRGTKEGCDASIDSHAPGYIDYSLGTRCCLDPP